MRIGELAKVTKCTVETIRHYEREGLLPEPSRSTANYREYSPKHVERLRFIRNCRALDMAQDEIRALLKMLDRPASDCTSVNQLIEEHMEHVEVRICELLDLRQQLGDLRRRCQETASVDSCGILRELADMASRTKARSHHLS